MKYILKIVSVFFMISKWYIKPIDVSQLVFEGKPVEEESSTVFFVSESKQYKTKKEVGNMITAPTSTSQASSILFEEDFYRELQKWKRCSSP